MPLPMSEEGSSKQGRDKKKLIAAGIYVAIAIFGALLLLPDAWYLWILILAICLYRIFSILSAKPAYRCESCGTVFRARGRRATLRPTAQDLYASQDEPKCPKCGSKTLSKTKVRD